MGARGSMAHRLPKNSPSGSSTRRASWRRKKCP